MLKNCVTQSLTKIADDQAVYQLNYKRSELSMQEFLTKSSSFDQKTNTKENIEDLFWRNVDERANVNVCNPVYGIDNEVSLYQRDCQFWNLNKITSDVSIIHTTSDMPGVNTSFWYAGMTFTSFGEHLEDSNLGSINQLLKGADKIWYSTPACHGKKLADFIQQFCPKNTDCDLIIRHKSTLVAPSVLKKMGIPFAKVNSSFCLSLNQSKSLIFI